jgi:ABC-type sugar transport system substrate-binding protein
VDEDLVAFAGFDVDRARSVIGALLDRRPDITALLAANNLLAQAAYTELADRRISIPGRVSLVAYDDVPWMSMVRPRVTTVAQHADEIGRRSADLLISRLQDANRRTAVSVLVNPSLVHRESVGAPFGGSRRRRRSVAPATPAPATPSAGLSAPDAAPGPVAASTASRGTAGSTADAAAPAGA